MNDFETIIENGFVIDGTGSPGGIFDIGIRDGKIAEVGSLGKRSAEKRIDAEGAIVAPGHVCPHTHYDVQIFWDPSLSTVTENGCTTVVNSNCGFGIAPARKADHERTMAMLSTTEQIPVVVQRAALDWDWESFPEFMDKVRKTPKGVNVYTYLPLNPLLVYVMGIDAAKTRQPNSTEIAQMHELINEAMDEGAIGISMSVMGEAGNSHVDFDGTSMPTDLLTIDSILAIGQALIDRGEGVIQMLSQIVHFGDRSFTERMAEACRNTGVRVLHNTFLTSDSDPESVQADLDWIRGLRARGLDVISPIRVNRAWVEVNINQLDTAAGQYAGVRRLCGCTSDEETMALISDQDFIKEFSEEYRERGALQAAANLENQIVIEVGDDPKLQSYLGKRLGEVAEERGEDVVVCLLGLAKESNLQLNLKSDLISGATPDQAVEVLREPSIYPSGSDGGAHTKSFDHANYQTDLLVWVCREHQQMSLEEMHHNLSLKQARAVSILDRGAILPGFWADLIIYRLDELRVNLDRYRIAHDAPGGDWRRLAGPGGYRMVMVNGEVTCENDEYNGAVPGHLARITNDFRPAARD